MHTNRFGLRELMAVKLLNIVFNEVKIEHANSMWLNTNKWLAFEIDWRRSSISGKPSLEFQNTVPSLQLRSGHWSKCVVLIPKQTGYGEQTNFPFTTLGSFFQYIVVIPIDQVMQVIKISPKLLFNNLSWVIQNYLSRYFKTLNYSINRYNIWCK